MARTSLTKKKNIRARKAPAKAKVGRAAHARKIGSSSRSNVMSLMERRRKPATSRASVRRASSARPRKAA